MDRCAIRNFVINIADDKLLLDGEVDNDGAEWLLWYLGDNSESAEAYREGEGNVAVLEMVLMEGWTFSTVARLQISDGSETTHRRR